MLKNEYEELIGKCQAQLQIEIKLRHFKRAKELLDSIENIVHLSDGRQPSWKNNSMEIEIMDALRKVEVLSKNEQPTLSASSIKAYETCPLKYKYQYVNHIPGAPEKPYFQLGKVIHKVLELFHKNEMDDQKNLQRIGK